MSNHIEPSLPLFGYNASMRRSVLIGLLIFAIVALVTGWLLLTPSGLLGKADAFGYSVCHQAPSRSFNIGGRPLPLCARCSGTFLGTLLGLAYLSTLGRKAGLPPIRIAALLMIFLGAFAVDGLNSFVRIIPGIPYLYTSHNWLRLVTGTGVGLGIASILLPVVHQSFWTQYTDSPLLANWKQMGILLGLAALLDLALLSDNALILYPLAVLSGLAVPIILTIIYAVLWVLVTKQENRYHRLKDLWLPALAGFLTAMLQISLIDAGRYWLMGTWAGIPLIN